MNASDKPSPSLEHAIKTLWGASTMPFANEENKPFQSKAFSKALQRLCQLVNFHSSGLIIGENGVGKSFLVHQFLHKINEKAYQKIVLTHSSLSGSGLLRLLNKELGQNAFFRREDTIGQIHKALQQSTDRWPILILEEAQNLAASTLEEIRLLTCHNANTAMPFSLILVGDLNLMPRLLMGINRPLMSRLSFTVQLSPMPLQQSKDYIAHKLQQAAVLNNPFEDNAIELICQCANGIPRTINNIAQRAFEAAAYQHSQSINCQFIQFALDQMPWLSQK